MKLFTSFTLFLLLVTLTACVTLPVTQSQLPATTQPPVTTTPPAATPTTILPSEIAPIATQPPTLAPTEEPTPTPEPLPILETTASGLPVYRLSVDAADWQTLITTNPETLGNTEFPFTLTSGEVSLTGLIRLRGASTRYYEKKSFKLKFDKGQEFLGRKELNLLASAADATMFIEKFWYDVFEQTGALVSEAEHVELHVNEAYYGLMTDVESVSSKSFLKAHGLEQDATIYRTNWYFMFLEESDPAMYDYMLTKVTHDADPSRADAIAFIEGLNRVPDDQFADWLAQRMDVDLYINYMVGDALTSQDWMAHSRSFLIYEPESGQWAWVPWDLLNSATTNMNPIVDAPPYVTHPPTIYTVYEYAYQPLTHGPDVGPGPEWSVLKTRVLDNPQFRQRYIARLKEALETTFTEEALFPYIDAQYARLEASALADPFALAYGTTGYVYAGPEWVKQYVTGRRAYLFTQLETLRTLGETGLYINEVGETYVELYNAHGADYDLSGHYLSNSLHEPYQYIFPSGTVIPAGGYWVITDFAFSTNGGAIGLFKPVTLEQAYTGDHGVLDFVYYGTLPPGGAYARPDLDTDGWAVSDWQTPGY